MWLCRSIFVKYYFTCKLRQKYKSFTSIRPNILIWLKRENIKCDFFRLKCAQLAALGLQVRDNKNMKVKLWKSCCSRCPLLLPSLFLSYQTSFFNLFGQGVHLSGFRLRQFPNFQYFFNYIIRFILLREHNI